MSSTNCKNLVKCDKETVKCVVCTSLLLLRPSDMFEFTKLI